MTRSRITIVCLAAAVAVAIGLLVCLDLSNGQTRRAIERLDEEVELLAFSLRDHESSNGKMAAEQVRFEEMLTALTNPIQPEKIRLLIRELEMPGRAAGFRNNLDSSYAALFKKLQLPHDRLNALRDLLAERSMAENEANRLALADDLMLDDLPDKAAIMNAATWEMDQAIEALLGSEEGAVFVEYQNTVRTRKWLLQPFVERLRAEPEPLRDDQIDQLARACRLTSSAPGHSSAAIRRPHCLTSYWTRHGAF